MQAEASRSARLVEFDRFRFDFATARLFDGDGPILAPPKALETLSVLLEHRDRLVSKEELLSLVWRDVVVEEANLAQQVFTLRRLLGDDAERPRFIATLPRRGYRFIADVREAGSPSDHPSPWHTPAPAARGTPRQRLRPPIWLTRTALVISALAIVAVLLARWAVRTVSFEIDLPAGTTLDVDAGVAGVSPDGSHVAFLAHRSGEARLIWVKPLEGGEAVPLYGSEGASLPFWSPDSLEVGFFAASKLSVIRASGGAPPRDVCAAGEGAGASWGRNDIILFATSSRSGISAVAAGGGSPRPITSLDSSHRDVSHRYPQFLPDGRHFLFLLWSGDIERQGIYLGAIDGSGLQRLLPDASPAVWSAGSLLFVRRDTLLAQRITPSFQLEREPRVLAGPVARDPSDRAPFAASFGGDLAFAQRRLQTRLAWYGRDGRLLEYLGPAADHWADPSVTSDGRRIAFSKRDRARGNENLDLWVESTTTRTPSPLTLDPAIDVLPVFSPPDGREVVFRSNRSGFSDLYRKTVDTAAAEERIMASDLRKDPTDWTPDGASIVFTQFTAPGNTDIWLLPLDPRRGKARPLVQGPAEERNGRVSPDERFLAYDSDEASPGRPEIFVRSLGGDMKQWRVSREGGRAPQWRRDGHELYFVAGGSRVTAVDVHPAADGLAFGTPHVLFEVPIVAWLRNGMAAAPDGQRFLITVDESGAPSPLKVVLNWQR